MQNSFCLDCIHGDYKLVELFDGRIFTSEIELEVSFEFDMNFFSRMIHFNLLRKTFSSIFPRTGKIDGEYEEQVLEVTQISESLRSPQISRCREVLESNNPVEQGGNEADILPRQLFDEVAKVAPRPLLFDPVQRCPGLQSHYKAIWTYFVQLWECKLQRRNSVAVPYQP